MNTEVNYPPGPYIYSSPRRSLAVLVNLHWRDIGEMCHAILAELGWVGRRRRGVK